MQLEPALSARPQHSVQIDEATTIRTRTKPRFNTWKHLQNTRRRQHLWLLESMLPKRVISSLRYGQEFAETFDCVTILFSGELRV